MTKLVRVVIVTSAVPSRVRVIVSINGDTVTVVYTVKGEGVTVTARRELQSAWWAATVAGPFAVPVTARAQLF